MSETLIPKHIDLPQSDPPRHPGPESPRKPLWERALELARAIPEEERALFPADGSVELDHYVYGTPKRSQ